MLAVEHATERTSQNHSKVDHYGWTFKDERGEMKWVAKGLIHVDYSYQRSEITNDRVLQIAREWSWMKCGALLLSRRPDGSLWTYDGQHRKLAADKRSDIQELPCVIFNVEFVANEAEAFLGANTLRGPVKSREKFKASCCAGDATAIAINQMIEASGYKVGRAGSFQVECIAAIRRDYELDAAVARDIWRLCTDLYQGDCPHERVWAGLCYLERFLRDRGEAGNDSLMLPHNRDAILKIGSAQLLQKIGAASGFYSRGGAKVWAQGIVAAVGHKRRSRRLPDVMGDGAEG